MKSLRLTTFFLCCLLLSSAQTWAAGMDFFKGSLEEAIAKAKAENKLVFVDAYAAWCGPCKMMERSTFKEDVVGDYYNANFINLKLNVDKEENADFVATQGLRSIPYYAFLDGAGKTVHTGLGFIETDDFVALGKKAMNNWKESQMSAEDIAAQVPQAASSFCEIMTPMVSIAKEMEAAGEGEDVSQFQEKAMKQMELLQAFQEQYDGKMANEVFLESFMKELEVQCEEVYTLILSTSEE